MRSEDYGRDVLANRKRKTVPELTADPGLVVEDPVTGFCGAVVRFEYGNVVLEDRHGREKLFALRPAGFLVDGKPVTLTRPMPSTTAKAPVRSASGSVKVAGLRARTARDSRIWVEGVHDAELVERVWGHDLRVEGVVVEVLDGIDDLAAVVRDVAPGPGRRMGVLVDHLVAGTKEWHVVEEARAVRPFADHLLVVGHPYVDVWQSVRPERLGMDAWPVVPRGTSWKAGIARHLGWPHDSPADLGLAWRR
ncbi:MAG TPA: DUF3097 family protein, partial [Umezawaea sp.]|nr:DUF3097 family protein [Umezawaea sp.]